MDVQSVTSRARSLIPSRGPAIPSWKADHPSVLRWSEHLARTQSNGGLVAWWKRPDARQM